MIIDSHQHFWDITRFKYPWQTPESELLYKNYLPIDLKPLIHFTGIEATVVVQAMSSHEETMWLLELAEENEWILGIVGWVDLQDKQLNKKLEVLKNNPKLKSIRHQVEDESNQEWLLQEFVLNGLSIISEFDYRFDALLKHNQLWQLECVLERCPNLNIVIDHAAKPDIKNNRFEEWAKNIEKAAALPIHCKLSGLFTEADCDSWVQEDIEPYFTHILNVFGADRIMFGSDWPVSTLASDYQRTVNTALSLCSNLSNYDQEKIFYTNAKKFYQL